jgi:hypothetical protein
MLVTKVEARDCSLAGSLPTTWGDKPGLSSLVYILLGRNALRGPLPTSWYRLPRVLAVDVERNQISGQLPPEWGNWGVMYLYLQDNPNLTGQVPCKWTSMWELEYMYLDRTGITGCWPSAELQAKGSAEGTSLSGVRGEWWGSSECGAGRRGCSTPH